MDPTTRSADHIRSKKKISENQKKAAQILRNSKENIDFIAKVLDVSRASVERHTTAKKETELASCASSEVHQHETVETSVNNSDEAESIGTVDDFNHRDIENAAALQRLSLSAIRNAKTPQDLRAAAFVARAAQDIWRIAVGLAKQIDFSKMSDPELKHFISNSNTLRASCECELINRKNDIKDPV